MRRESAEFPPVHLYTDKTAIRICRVLSVRREPWANTGSAIAEISRADPARPACGHGSAGPGVTGMHISVTNFSGSFVMP